MKVDAARIEEIRALGLPRCTIELVERRVGFRLDVDDARRVALAEHLHHYSGAITSGGLFACPGCGGDSLGMFTWGIQHGAGFCGRCDWPGRFYHFIDDSLPRLDLVLWAHPDEVSTR